MARPDPMLPLALLAGGQATRLRPVTATIPKSMVEVAGQPFIAHQLRLLKREGVDDVVVCAGYLGAQIEAYVGDGARFGCRVRYSFDGDGPLGTGGALRRALPLLGARFLVMYGDSYLDTAFRPVCGFFQGCGALALMTVYRNDGHWDSSNVEFADGVIRRYDKNARTKDMHHIDYGLGAFDARAFDGVAETAFDLAWLYQALLARGQLAGYEVKDRFYEIGSPAGVAETDAYLRGRARVAAAAGSFPPSRDGAKP